jgi:hypothetical protein
LRPRTALGEDQSHRARLVATRRGVLDDHEPARHEPIASLQVAAPAEPSSRRRGLRARECALFSVREARQRKRDQPLARGAPAPRRSRRRSPQHQTRTQRHERARPDGQPTSQRFGCRPGKRRGACVWAESHRQPRSSAEFAMTSARTSGRSTTPRSRLRPRPGYTARTEFGRRWKAPMSLEDRVRGPVFLVSETGHAWWTAAGRHNLAAAIALNWGSRACFVPPLAASVVASCRIFSREPPTPIG